MGREEAIRSRLNSSTLTRSSSGNSRRSVRAYSPPMALIDQQRRPSSPPDTPGAPCAVAEFEKNVIVLKLRAARERKRARGERVEGVKPYGHFPAERAVLARMRQLRRKPPKGRRLSVAGIAAAINREGHRNRAGRDWSPQMVHHLRGEPTPRP